MYRLPDIEEPFDFPNNFQTSPEGLLAVGGNLHPDTLLAAYSRGIFPWFNRNDPILWWHPDPRLVLFPKDVHVSQNMHSLIKQQHYKITINSAFDAVLTACAATREQKRPDTWLLPPLVSALKVLHQKGYAHSVEIWTHAGTLVGGLYGVALGQVFFGESMFHLEPNTSKLALITLCKILAKNNYRIIDCQVDSAHLRSMGAKTIPRKRFLELLQAGETQLKQPGRLTPPG